MSRIGNRVINVPSNVNLTVNKTDVAIKGPLGNLLVNYPEVITVKQDGGNVTVVRANDEKQTRMYHGTVNANIQNAVTGVSTGFTKHLELKGVGYKANIEGSKLKVVLGFSHPLFFDIPKTLKVECPAQTEIKITGADKAEVGQYAAVIRGYRPPEPYKGKGVLYKGEIVLRKAGKTAEGSKKK